MRRIADAIRHRLHWAQPKLFDQRYELQSGTDVVATLAFRSAFGTMAEARSADGSWTFKRVGFWQTKATVRREGESRDVAVFEHDTWKGGGTLQIAGGPAILVTTNFWQSRIEFQLSEHEVLFRYLTEGFMRREAILEVLPRAERMAELPWLILFGWYLVVMMHHDAASAAVIVT
jgi:hypothetical protein